MLLSWLPWLLLPCAFLASRPASVGWVYVADPGLDSQADELRWEQVAFEAMDIMIVGPVGLQSCNTTPSIPAAFPWRPRFRCQEPWKPGGFGVEASYRERFETLLAVARRRNPGLEIMASQWYTSDLMEPYGAWGGSLEALGISEEQIGGYAKDVSTFLEKYNLTAYVLDYEGTNVVHWYTRLLVTLAEVFRDSATSPKRRIGISPSTAKYLQGTNSLTDYVFAQTYTKGVELQEFLGIFEARKVFVGLCPEGCSAMSAAEAHAEVERRKLAGVHVWRLNSNVANQMAKENAVMRQVHDLFSNNDTEAQDNSSRRKQIRALKPSGPSGFFNLLDSLSSKA